MIDIACEAHKICLALLLPSQSEVVGINEVNHGTDQDHDQSEHGKENEIFLFPGEPVV
jgi:hypothetical protein